MNVRTCGAVAVAAVFGLCAPATAQTPVEFDRRIEAVGVVPSAPGSNEHDIVVVWTIVAQEAPIATRALLAEGAGPTDLTSMIEVQAGLLLPAIQKVREAAANTDANPGGCQTGGCAGGCGTGSVDGQSVTLLCLQDPDCTPGSPCDCECRFPSITTVFPNVPVQPGDVIAASVAPTSGAAPDADATNDAMTLAFSGDPIFWNRRVKSISFTPATAPTAPEGDSFFDICVEIDVGFSGLTTGHSMALDACVVINGVAQAAAPLGCSDWLVAPGDPCMGCTALSCGTASCGGANVPMSCRIVENDWGASFCACVSDASTLTFPNVQVSPSQDKVVVVLKPAPGALPELPGFGDDDTGEPPAPCELCPGDLNGDGMVDGADLGLLLQNWGNCFPV